ncbi:repeat set, removed [Histoplasma ohiense]|nr:repeat set, removed [Histoplasma ohiense (nom. inval.)]
MDEELVRRRLSRGFNFEPSAYILGRVIRCRRCLFVCLYWFNVPEKTRAAPVFQKPPEGHGDVLRWRDSYVHREKENRIQVATLEKTQLIEKGFTELCIHFWPNVWPFMVEL